MEKNKELSISLQNEIYKQSLDSEFKKKFDECFLDFNDFNNLRCKATFHAYYTKYHWYGERHLFTKEHLVKNDFFDKFYLGVRNDAPNKKEECINCLEMFSDYIDYDYEIDRETVFNDGTHHYNCVFKKRKVKAQKK